MIRTILFDFDGTLYDTVEGIEKCAQYALNKLGIEAQLEELKCFAGPPLVDKFMEVYGFTRETAEKAQRLFKERYAPIGLYESCPFPGIKEGVVRLREKGYRVGIATSKPTHLAEELLERNGMQALFDCCCGSAPSGNNCKKSDVVRRAMELLGAKDEETVLIGDTKYDVFGAHEAGIRCVCVRYGYAAPGELEEAGADAIVEDLSALENFLDKDK